MTHVSTQTTLSNSIALEQRLYALDLESVAAWYAFELATTVAAPVSTDTLLSQHLFDELIAFEIMREAYTEERITRRALYEAFSWAYPSDIAHAPVLVHLLQHFWTQIVRAPAQAS